MPVREIRELEANPDFVPSRWRALKTEIAATRTTNLAGIAAKLRVALTALELEACRLDVEIIRSSIADLEYLSGID